ncbi:MAG: DUF1549 domain-containing protein [Roseimicrobium sp.]
MSRLSSSLAFLALSIAVTVSGAQPDVKGEAKKIDAILAKAWQKNKVKGNTLVSDATFVRRIYLDIAGRIPTTREVEQFMGDKAADKRGKLIDLLLSGEGYVQHMFNYWADILRLHSNGGQVGAITGTAYANFVKDSLRQNKPYDQFVRAMVGAQGKAWENGAIGYYMRDRGMPLDNMAATVRIFLGTRIECAQCHNHPFDKWSQKQFYEMAAFTYGVEANDYYSPTQEGARDILRKQEDAVRAQFKQPQLPKPKKEMTKEDWAAMKQASEQVGKQARLAAEKVRQDNRYVNAALNDMRDALRYTSVRLRDRKLTLPHDYQYPDMKPRAVVAAATMMGKPVDCPPEAVGPEAYAKWMTSPENPRFTNVIANRLWKKVFGMGLIEPVDELMDNTVAMNPDLMKHLEKLMLSVGYDMKAYLRVLYNTQAYQRSVTKEEIPAGMVYHFTGPILRRMSAEQMWDSFVALINPTPDMPNLPTHEQAARRIAMAHKLGDGLDALSPEEMLKGAQAAAEKYQFQAEKVSELQKKIAEARANDDKEKAKELSRELSGYDKAARRSINDNIYVPAVMKLAAKVTGSAAPVADTNAPVTPVLAQNEPSMMNSMMGNAGGTYERIKVPGYESEEKSVATEAAERAAQVNVFLDEASFYGVPEKQKRDYVKFRQRVVREWLRSAEIESPAPRGHYLREFGQSDRETIENANYDASVPQVLALMNSPLLPQILNDYSQLMLTVNKAPYAEEKVDAIFMTLLSRKPTAAEKEKWVKAQELGLIGYEDLIYALINTQQFVFIQ